MLEAQPPASSPAGSHLSRFVESHERLFVISIVLLGLGARLLHFFQIEANDPFFYHPAVDPKVYHEWASRIAAGDWIGKDVFFLSPLYPYFLALFYKLVGPSIYAARLLQLVIGAGSCALVYLVGKRSLSAAVGAIAALIWSVYSMSIFYDGILLVAALQTPLNLLLALSLLRASRTPGRLAPWGISGLLLGLSALARPNILLLTPLLLPWIYFSFRRKVGTKRVVFAAAVLCFATALPVLPVTMRNAVVGDDLVLVSAQGGANFYIGNGPGATGTFRVPSDFPPTRADDPEQQRLAYRKVAERDLGEDLKPSEVSRYWWSRAWSHMADDPGGALSNLGLKLALFFNEFESGNSRDYPSSRDFSLVLMLPLPTWGFVGPLALLGIALTLIRREQRAFPLNAFILVYAASLTVFFVLAHYRMPVVPFAVILAAYSICWILDRIRLRRLAPLGLAIAALSLAFVFCHWDLVDETGDRFIVHYNLGNKFAQLKDEERAAGEYERSIDLNPEYISAHHNLALLLEQNPDRRGRAIEAWEHVLELGRRNRDQRYVNRALEHLEYLRSRPR